jgi:hypothetical protein
MRNIAFGLAAVAAIAVATPALAQDVEFRSGSTRHEEGWRDRDHGPNVRLHVDRSDRSYARGRDCSMKTTRIHRSNGTVVTRRERSCD